MFLFRLLSGNSTVLFKPSMAPVNVKGTRIITPKPLSCKCFGQNLICHVCNQKPKEVAARAGTPGFRPPEVLLKSKHQTTAVDVWAAGIMMLCMISRTYPFFKVMTVPSRYFTI